MKILARGKPPLLSRLKELFIGVLAIFGEGSRQLWRAQFVRSSWDPSSACPPWLTDIRTFKHHSTDHLTPEQAAAAIVAIINARPRSPNQAEIAGIIARVATGILRARMHEATAPAIKLARRAGLLDSYAEGTPANAAARLEADKCKFEIERLRGLLASKSPKALDDIAALAVLALYWEGRPLEELARKCQAEEIAIGDRALPTLLLAVCEFFGIDRNESAG